VVLLALGTVISVTYLCQIPRHLAGHKRTSVEPTEPERNIFYLILAYLSAGLGIIGAFLPVLPTTPFLLVAAWAATRGSPELHRWLYQHPRFGPPLIAWEQQRAVSTGAKWLACSLMTLSWVIMFAVTESWLVPALTGALFLAVGGFLVTRPVP
jgi:uncharacterized membrane protein YbaN (DUF454 family)